MAHFLMQRLLLPALSIAALLAAPAGASAAAEAALAPNGDGTTLRVTSAGAADESLTATLEGDAVLIVDALGAVLPGEGCAGGEGSVTCPAAGLVAITVDLGDGSNAWNSAGLTHSTRYAGGSGSDVVRTGGGADVVEVGGGAGTIHGSPGNDRYVVEAAAASSGKVVLAGTDAGVDTLDMSPTSARWIGRKPFGKPWQLQVRGRAATVRPSSTIERFIFGGGGDTIDMDRFPGTTVTTWLLGGGDDQFQARTRGVRTIVDGGAGHDLLGSFLGSDIMRGGSGNDVLFDFGGTGDQLYGGSGRDALSSRDGKRDTLNGGAGTDACVTLKSLPKVTGCQNSDRRISIEKSLRI